MNDSAKAFNNLHLTEIYSTVNNLLNNYTVITVTKPDILYYFYKWIY